MDTRTATLIVRYKDTEGTWKRAAAVRGANGRIRPGYALIEGREEPVKNFQYQVRYYEQRKLRYESAGTKAAAADALRDRIEKQATAKAVAEDAGLKVEAEETRKTLLSTAAAYIRDAERRGATEAAAQARVVRDEFLRLIRKAYVDEITRDDVFRFHEALRKRRCSDRTVANKHQRLTSWLRFAGIERTILPPVPKYEQKLPTIYDRDQISTLLANADPAKRMMVLLGLKLGLRDQELKYAQFCDVHWNDKIFRVQGKPQWGFRPKTWEQRDIPVPDDLLTELKTWRSGRSDRTLILGTKNGRPNGKLLTALKTLARQAKLNCGHCSGCTGRSRGCQDYTLHHFRRTYITTLLRNGIDLRTVQAYAGHKDITSTMRYLRPATAKDVQAKMNAIEW